ncbi:MAG: Gfo/Idh/MocA family protein [bacterium]
MVRVGIVGAGHMGRTHALNLKGDSRVEIAGVVDIDENAASRLAGDVGARVFPDLPSLVKSGVDAIYVTSPNTRHAEPVLMALGEGMHVFSEKPMATSLKEASEIRDAAHSSRAIYQVGHNRRFAPVYKFVKGLIEGGEFKPYSSHIKMNRGELIDPPWVGDPQITGGFLYESTIHLLDMARWLLGDVLEVECKGKANVYGEIDDFLMLLTFGGGAYATFCSSAHSTWIFPFERVELFGDHSAVVTEEMERVTYSPGLSEEIVTRDFFQISIPRKWGYEEEDRLFIDAIEKGGPSPVSADEGYKSVELVEACYLSARSGGEKIKLPIEISS